MEDAVIKEACPEEVVEELMKENIMEVVRDPPVLVCEEECYRHHMDYPQCDTTHVE